jgi:hypothetical protein
MEKEMRKQYRDFESAREFVMKLKLKKRKEWEEYCKSGNKPDDIPSSPHSVYKKEWKGVGDFLGTGYVAPSDRKHLPYKEARQFARSLGLKSFKEWNRYCNSGDKPDDIPAELYQHYKNEFKGIGDFLGTGVIAPKDRVFRSFAEAREFARSLGLRSNLEWRQHFKLNKRPDDIPYKVERTYKKEWKGWGDFLGTGTVASQDMEFLPFIKARKFATLLNLKSFKDWQEYCKSGDKPDDIPAVPVRTYKKEWKGWGYWLGTGTIASYNKEFRPFAEAREFVRSLGLKNTLEWNRYCNSGDKPDDIPSAPWNTYNEWKQK